MDRRSQIVEILIFNHLSLAFIRRNAFLNIMFKSYILEFIEFFFT